MHFSIATSREFSASQIEIWPEKIRVRLTKDAACRRLRLQKTEKV
jgi:hypothetical protein